MKAKTAIDPIFAEYARTAPRLDLQRYIHYASDNDHTFNAATIAIVGEMAALYVALSAGKVKGTPAAHKRIVWAVIARFKGSIAGWSGNAGSDRFDRMTSHEWLIANGLAAPDSADPNAADVATPADCEAVA